MCSHVLVAQVRLYMDCEEYHRVSFTRSAQPLTFEDSSGIFVGNAGGTGLARFVVSLDRTGFIVACLVCVYKTTVSVHHVLQHKHLRMVLFARALHVINSSFLMAAGFGQLTVVVKPTFIWRNKRGVWAFASFTFETGALVFVGSFTTAQKTRNE